MSITFKAIYENGVLKPDKPLPLKERERVQVTVQAPPEIETAVERVRATAGLIACRDPELVQRIALDLIEDV